VLAVGAQYKRSLGPYSWSSGHLHHFQPWEEIFSQRVTKSKKGSIPNIGNKVCSLDLLNCVFA
jgi:hypothetical protein